MTVVAAAALLAKQKNHIFALFYNLHLSVDCGE